jgi:hypothetical protein
MVLTISFAAMASGEMGMDWTLVIDYDHGSLIVLY